VNISIFKKSGILILSFDQFIVADNNITCNFIINFCIIIKSLLYNILLYIYVITIKIKLIIIKLMNKC